MGFVRTRLATDQSVAPPPLVKIPSAAFLALTAALLLLTSGCYSPPGYRSVNASEIQPAYAPEANVPTALVIVVEGECSEAEYLARRGEIINYLIERGYITSESDLVSDPAEAVRIIRAIVSGDGFSLSVFNQNSAADPMPDLETTDILYPADPYFIFGFDYLYEIGPRRLGPRPQDYRPHPRPPHEGPPRGHPVFDHDRHWSRPGEPRRDNTKDAPRPNRRPRDGSNPQPDRTRQPSAPGMKPDDHRPARPDDHANPPPAGNQSRKQDHPRPEQTALPPSPAPGKNPGDNDLSRQANRPKLPPDRVAPRGPDRPQPDKNGPMPPPARPPRSPDRQPAPETNRPSPNTPPAPTPPPAPEKASNADNKAPAGDDKDQRKQQQN